MSVEGHSMKDWRVTMLKGFSALTHFTAYCSVLPAEVWRTIRLIAEEIRAHYEMNNCLQVSVDTHSLIAHTFLWEELVHISAGASERMHVYTLYSPTGNIYHKNLKHTLQS